jgi:phosphoesterase RecJ-like protein
MKLSKEMLLEYPGVTTADVTPLIDIVMSIKGIKATFIVKEDLNNEIRVSLRSKNDIDVSQVAFNFGGGGHKNASGYKSDKSLQETYDSLTDAILKVIC